MTGDDIDGGEMTGASTPTIGTVEQYSAYLNANQPKEHVVKMLRANALGPTTSALLARAAGWDSYRAANLHYGRFAKDVGRWLGLTLEPYKKDDTEFFTSAIATASCILPPQAGGWEYKLHTPFLQALRQNGIVPDEQTG